ncbi:MAG: 3-deoxy-D-manno-octulosonic acid kinase [Gemmatimonadales bacterium]|nr:MAG: 3-deoxy-D-manno-octulosonic acid kinase [Gemmatimonadales bacterium]
MDHPDSPRLVTALHGPEWVLGVEGSPVEASIDLFRPGAGTSEHRLEAGRGHVRFFRWPAREPEEGEVGLVHRSYYRGGLPGRLVRRRYLWTGLARTRPVRELVLAATLHRWGLPVPDAVAARVHRRGPTWEGDLVTVEVPRSRTLADRIREGSAPPQLWAAAGRSVRRLHDAGAWHADLNVRNLLADDADRIWVIDWDRGQIRRVRPGWRQSNLLRLRRSLSREPALDAAARERWSCLMEGYMEDGGPSGPPAPEPVQ